MTLKLMTSNVWADVFGNPVHPRDKLLCEIVKEERPDVLFLQEMHPGWYRSDLLPCLATMGYVMSKPETGENRLNYTPLLYLAEKFTEQTSRFLLYEGPNDYDSKSVSASLLSDNETGCRFAVASTHMYFAQNEAGNKVRISNANELCGLLDEFKNVPVFCGGDFNCDTESEPFEVLAYHGIRCCSLAASERLNFIRTDHGNPVYDKFSGIYTPAEPSDDPNCLSIDHVVFKGNAVIKSYNVISDKRACIVSDHCPVVITAEL